MIVDGRWWKKRKFQRAKSGLKYLRVRGVEEGGGRIVSDVSARVNEEGSV